MPPTSKPSGACPGYVIDHVKPWSAAEPTILQHAVANHSGRQGEGQGGKVPQLIPGRSEPSPNQTAVAEEKSVKKPWFIRLFGWLFWCGSAWIGFVWISVLVAGSDPQIPQDTKAGIGLALLGTPIYFGLTGFCLVVWLVGSLVAWHAPQKNPPAPHCYPAPPVIQVVTVQPALDQVQLHPRWLGTPTRPCVMTSPLGLSGLAGKDQGAR